MSRKITKVIVENFQSHEYTEVDFGDFNGIIGPSDNGKTALIRAVIWALYNNPSGNSYVRKGESKCQVTILFNDGASIVKTRTPKIHSYDLCEPGGEPVHLEAFGVGPVDEVVSFHRMGFVDLFGEKQTLNICEQLDAPFFLGESPATKALIIGRLGNTEVIDKAIKNNAADLREVKAEIKVYKGQLKEVKSELKELKSLDKMGKAIEVAKVKLDKIKMIEAKNENILQISKKIKDKMEQVQKLEKFVGADEEMNDIISVLDDLIQKERKLANIKEINRKIKQGEKRIEELSSAGDIDITEVISVIDSLDECIEKSKNLFSIKRVKNSMNSLERDLDNIKSLAGKDEDANIALEKIEEALNLVKVKTSILNVKGKYDSCMARKAKGEAIIKNLDESYSKSIKQYKDALKQSQKCPICMSQLSDDKLEGIEHFI